MGFSFERGLTASVGNKSSSARSSNRAPLHVRDVQTVERLRRAQPESMLRVSLAAVAVLVAVSTAAEIVRRTEQGFAFREGLADVLSVDTELGIAAMFSTVVLIAAGVTAWRIGGVRGELALPFRRRWLMAGVMLLILSVEEYIGVHNLLADRLMEMIDDPATVRSHLWVIPPTAAGALMVAAYASLVRTLPSTIGRVCAVAATMYILGGVGVDALGHSYLEGGQRDFGYVAFFTIEEVLELVAAALILYGVSTFGRDHLDAP